MVLGSDVPLEEDILRKQVEFIQSWLEWSSQHRELVSRNATQTGSGTATVMTVPQNQTFYLTGAWLGIQNSGLAGARAATLFFDNISAPNSIFFQISAFEANSSDNNSITYPMPLKFESGSVIQLTVGASTNGRAGIIGFLVDKRIS